ncbi:MAG: VTT domain-containing protein [Anaerolineae bacterium]|nr:VTT domain-containing protein [Thermoflexales bacterium]MDW8408325.1 VTT domain-containing protein [Anaerolineae bacterium]
MNGQDNVAREGAASADGPAASAHPQAPAQNEAGASPSPVRSAVSLALAVLISVGVFWLTSRYRDDIQSLGNAGLIGLFALSVIGNATVVIPAPVFVFACAAGTLYNGVAVGIVAGLGAALGELTGYLAGYGGAAVVPQGELYDRVRAFMRRRGMLAIFLLAALPNPIFDVGGILAGVLRLPAWQFVLSAWAGKAVRLGTLAWVCLAGAPWLRQLFGLP